MITLRRALDSDALLLARFAEQTFRATFASGTAAEDMDLYCANAYGEALQRKEIADPGLVTSFAEIDGRLVGFSQWRRSQSIDCVTAERPSELSRIYVARECQGRGVAQALMQDVISRAAESNCDVLWLGVWEHNSKAIAFYRKFGFEVVGDHSFTVGRDVQRDLIMVRSHSIGSGSLR